MFSQELTCEHLELRVFNSLVKSERYELSQKKKSNSCMTNAEDTNIKKN